MGIQAETGLIFGKLSSKEDTEIIPQKEQLFPFAWYLNSDLLCTVSHSSVMCFDQDGKTAWENQFDENQVYCADISEGKHLVMVLRDDAKSGSTAKGDKTLVRIYDKEGKVYGESSIEGKVKNIKTYGSMIAVNAGREIYVISPKGKILDKCSSKTDVSELFFIDGKNLALVTNSKIIINQINS
jgi:outer membrane protein assembly factor BamB